MFSHLFTQYAVLKITNGTDCCGIPIIKETLKIDFIWSIFAFLSPFCGIMIMRYRSM